MRRNSFVHCKLLSLQLMGRFGFFTNHLANYCRIAHYNKILIDPWTRNFSSEKSSYNIDFVVNQLGTHGSKQIFKNSVSSVAVNPEPTARSFKYKEQRKSERPESIVRSKKIEAYAEIGDIDTCLVLYEKMLKQNFRPLPKTTSMIFAAISKHKRNGVHHLSKLISLLNYYNVKLTTINYVIALKTSIQLQCGYIGLNIYDEMKRKHVAVDNEFYRLLLECVYYSKENTLETNLIIWHTMLKSDYTPKLSVFKILLSNLAFAQCNATKLERCLSRNSDTVEIQVRDDGETNLLANPPVLSKSSLSRFGNENGDISLKDIFEKDKLFLLGGYNNILRMIKMSGHTPDDIVISWLLRLLPDSMLLEDELINQADKMQIPLTTHFFNILIQRRCLRFDYEAAKDVLVLMEAENVKPDQSTWEALAYTCHHYTDIEKFLYHLDNSQQTASDITLRRLIRNIAHTKSNYKLLNLSHLMGYISKNNLEPSEKTIKLLDSFVIQCEELKQRRADELASNVQLINYKKFLNLYHGWRNNYQHNVTKS